MVFTVKLAAAGPITQCSISVCVVCSSVTGVQKEVHQIKYMFSDDRQ